VPLALRLSPNDTDTWSSPEPPRSRARTWTRRTRPTARGPDTDTLTRGARASTRSLRVWLGVAWPTRSTATTW
jgi:hypothetical protein